jgi:hypothetical protein
MVVKHMVVKRGGASGVTLIELLIAISLSSLVILMALALFKDVGFASRLAGGKRDVAFQARSALASLSGNLLTGGGVLRLAPGEVVVLNRRNRRVTYAWGDSVLKANGKPYGFRLVSLRIDPAGPVRPGWKAFAGEMPWDLDSLDGDHNGTIDSTELDRNADGVLDTEECRFLASLRLTLVASAHGVPITLTGLVHPRNRAKAGTEAEAGDPDDPGGIPEP